MADTVKNAPGSAGDWEFLYGKTIPFKHELHVFLWHLPGVVCALALGMLANMVLEEILKRISKSVAESRVVMLAWMGLVVYLVSAKIHWSKIVPRPPAR
jgi:NhaP-type Na+/H+ or K+/H+ antiporter